MISIDYKIPPYGLGSDFSDYERPMTFAKTYQNRFRNVTGGAERRPGMARFASAVAGKPNLTRLHEFVDKYGNETVMSSDDNGNIWAYNTSAAAWDNVLTGKTAVRMISGEAAGKLIFVNGKDRNIYTDDGGKSFHELQAIITQGIAAGGTNTTTLIDGQISNWINDTLVANNDIIHNITRDAYGIVSTVTSASLTMTAIGSAARGAGYSPANQTAGDVYELIDYVNLNIIPSPDNVPGNTATATTGTTIIVVAVSGVDFSATEIRVGDIIYNTTRAAISFVSSVSANINLQRTITGQTSGDALAFFKSAMPVASWIHVHYGRAYYLDSRDQNRIVISAPDDPQDVTTFQKTLDASSFSFGTQQPAGDVLLTMTTFQKYFVAGGKKNLYIYQGVNPIQDNSGSTTDFEPVAFYPTGVAGRFALGTNGSDLLHIAQQGLEAINIGNISNTTVSNNASVPVRTAIINAVQAAQQDDVQVTFYPRRSWLVNKVSDQCWVLNTNPTYNDIGQLQTIASWHLFTGKWAQQNHYFIRRNGDLLACGLNGLVYQMDSSASTDDGDNIQTDLVMPWLRMEEPQRTVRVKRGHYIKPVFESSPEVVYTINAVAGWDNLSSDTIQVSAGGTGFIIGNAVIGQDSIGSGDLAQSNKYPLQWRGEQVQIEFATDTSASPDIITGFTLYGDISGVR